MSEQPQAILDDSKKALRLYHERNFDRFDELLLVDFWVNMVEIMRSELVSAAAHPNPTKGSE